MKKIITTMCLLAVITLTKSRKFAVDKQWVCNIKKSCFECLRLDHCSWCPTENKCFSSILAPEEFCKNDAFAAKDFGLSIDGNAECACNGSDMVRNCHHPGLADGPECSGRGTCECGRCVCNAPEHPSQTVLGEYCEFDNFSCDDPDCDEGPYPLNRPEGEEGITVTTTTPSEMPPSPDD